VLLCINSNAIEHRKISQSVTLGMYRHFGFKRIESLLSEFNQSTLKQLVPDI
jgi:hypothetical protein